ncbi:MAG: TlpA disulfide reductase family protein [Alphaproteobacteria bacterium]|nr:TlpA disulfide reductase family protein [Alphaproteobacteria bacterium]
MTEPLQPDRPHLTRRSAVQGMAAAALGGCLLPAGASFAASGEPPLLETPRNQFTLLEPTRPAPTGTFLNDSGVAVGLDIFAGRVVLLNFWATWCEPCLRELPSLDLLQAARGGADFVVVPMALDDGGRKAIRRYYDQLLIQNLGIYVDLARRIGGENGLPVFGLPMTYVIDHEAIVRGFIVGEVDWSGPDARRLIDWYIARKRGSA